MLPSKSNFKKTAWQYASGWGGNIAADNQGEDIRSRRPANRNFFLDSTISASCGIIKYKNFSHPPSTYRAVAFGVTFGLMIGSIALLLLR